MSLILAGSADSGRARVAATGRPGWPVPVGVFPAVLAVGPATGNVLCPVVFCGVVMRFRV